MPQLLKRINDMQLKQNTANNCRNGMKNTDESSGSQVKNDLKHTKKNINTSHREKGLFFIVSKFKSKLSHTMDIEQ